MWSLCTQRKDRITEQGWYRVISVYSEVRQEYKKAVVPCDLCVLRSKNGTQASSGTM